jgi:hypothetical protein
MTPTSGQHQSSSIHSMRERNTSRGLLVPHTASNKKGDRLSRSSRTPLAPPSAVIPVEEPKRKKRKYHPELVPSGPELPSHRNNPVAPVPSRSKPRSQLGQQFTRAPETEWDDGIYVGANGHPLFTIPAVPADSEDTPKRNVSLSFAPSYRRNINQFETQTSTDYMRSWLPLIPQYCNIILSREAPPSHDSCSNCLRAPGIWRCQDCTSRRHLCSSCMRDRHGSNPFHRISFWTGTHYKDAWLRDVGLCIYLGHDGEPCPHNLVPAELLSTRQFSPSSIQRSHPPGSNLASYEFTDISMGFEDEDPDDPLVDMGHMPSELDGDPSIYDDYDLEQGPGLGLGNLEKGPEMRGTLPDHSRKNGRARSRAKLPAYDSLGNRILTFVHSNGIHGLGVRFCQCPETRSDDRHLHLLNAGFYPATQTNPSTVFTLSGLDYALIDNLECKTVLNAYSKKLRRLSDENDPGTVPVFLLKPVMLYNCQLISRHSPESLCRVTEDSKTISAPEDINHVWIWPSAT